MRTVLRRPCDVQVCLKNMRHNRKCGRGRNSLINKYVVCFLLGISPASEV